MNIPSYDPDNLSFGPGIVYFGAVGATPISDIGAVDQGMTLEHGVEEMTMPQGNPDFIIKTVRTEDSVRFTFTGLEWRISNLEKYLGAGHLTGDEFKFGGDIDFTETSLRLIHWLPLRLIPGGGSSQKWITIDVWRARSDGSLSLSFSSDVHKFPVILNALPALKDWSGAPLAQGEEYYRLKMQEAVVTGDIVRSPVLTATASLYVAPIWLGYPSLSATAGLSIV